MYELADMIIVSAGIARFDYALGLSYIHYSFTFADIASIEVEDVWKSVEKKMKKNRKRVWNKMGDGRYHHENGIED